MEGDGQGENGFDQVKRGPRGQRKEQNVTFKKSNGAHNHHRREAAEEPHLTYGDLKYQLSLLQKRVHSPKVDLVENESSCIVRMEVPGFFIQDLKIEIQGNQFLLVSGYKKEECSETKVIYKECRYGNFMRRVKLPALVSGFEVDTMENGVLTVICEKKNGAKVHLDSSLDESYEVPPTRTPPNTPSTASWAEICDLGKDVCWADVE